MPKDIVEAFKLDLQSKYISVISRNNWAVLCTRVLQTIYNSKNFNDSDFPMVTKYVLSRSKDEVIKEIYGYAIHPERMLGNYGMITKSASTTIIFNVFRELLNEAIEETLNVNNIFDVEARKRNVEYIKKQLELGDFKVITRTKRQMIRLIFEDGYSPIKENGYRKLFSNVDIKDVIYDKIDTLNLNDNYKKWLKTQVEEGTIKRDELERYKIITPEEIDEYFGSINHQPTDDGFKFSK